MQSFRRLTLATLVAVYVLIAIGGVVRSTGSGMGCPDWPRCFGSFVPPSSIDDLPENYKEIYSDYRAKKNRRFATYLRALGMHATADKLLNDRSVLQEADFNPVKTWIEYFNRVAGVVIGFLIIAVAWASWKFRKTHRVLTVMAFLSLALVIFQGWIGSFVVSTNLTPWTVTLHMILAMVLVAILVYLYWRTDDRLTSLGQRRDRWIVAACMVSLLVQVVMGTGVREALDVAAAALPRTAWIEAAGDAFIRHRTFSWIVLILHVILAVKLVKTQAAKSFTLLLILLILGTILTGAGMAYFGVPPVLQPLHLVLATVTFGFQFLLLLRLKRNTAGSRVQG